MLRAPEARMLLLSPIFLIVIFGGLYWRTPAELPLLARPLPAFGALSMILLSLIGVVGNQFGFDRGGFRIFVLSPASRRDILLGKNLAVLPLAFALFCPLLILVQVIYPLRLDHLFAMAPQFVSMYLLFCLIANFVSILAPMAIAAGSLKAADSRLVPALIRMFFLSLMPLVLAPTLLPLGMEFGLETLGWVEGMPVCLVLTVMECAAIVWLYHVVLTWQGRLLHGRELRIIEVVTTKAE